jgi:hypothetical protein
LFFNYHFQVPDALWKNIHGKMVGPGNVFFTDMPVTATATAKPVLSKHEGKQQVCNVDFIHLDEQSETQENKLRNSTALIWTDEEVAPLLFFHYHNFSMCIILWAIILF